MQGTDKYVILLYATLERAGSPLAVSEPSVTYPTPEQIDAFRKQYIDDVKYRWQTLGYADYRVNLNHHANVEKRRYWEGC